MARLLISEIEDSMSLANGYCKVISTIGKIPDLFVRIVHSCVQNYAYMKHQNPRHLNVADVDEIIFVEHLEGSCGRFTPRNKAEEPNVILLSMQAIANDTWFSVRGIFKSEKTFPDVHFSAFMFEHLLNTIFHELEHAAQFVLTPEAFRNPKEEEALEEVANTISEDLERIWLSDIDFEREITRSDLYWLLNLSRGVAKSIRDAEYIRFSAMCIDQDIWGKANNGNVYHGAKHAMKYLLALSKLPEIGEPLEHVIILNQPDVCIDMSKLYEPTKVETTLVNPPPAIHGYASEPITTPITPEGYTSTSPPVLPRVVIPPPPLEYSIPTAAPKATVIPPPPTDYTIPTKTVVIPPPPTDYTVPAKAVVVPPPPPEYRVAAPKNVVVPPPPPEYRVATPKPVIIPPAPKQVTPPTTDDYSVPLDMYEEMLLQDQLSWDVAAASLDEEEIAMEAEGVAVVERTFDAPKPITTQGFALMTLLVIITKRIEEHAKTKCGFLNTGYYDEQELLNGVIEGISIRDLPHYENILAMDCLDANGKWRSKVKFDGLLKGHTIRGDFFKPDGKNVPGVVGVEQIKRPLPAYTLYVKGGGNVINKWSILCQNPMKLLKKAEDEKKANPMRPIRTEDIKWTGHKALKGETLFWITNNGPADMSKGYEKPTTFGDCVGWVNNGEFIEKDKNRKGASI